MKPNESRIQDDPWYLLGGFDDRFAAMTKLARTLADQLKDKDNAALYTLLTQFSGFAQEYYRFFKDDAELKAQAIDTTRYTLLKNALESLQAEWENIGRACLQYLYTVNDLNNNNLLKIQLNNASIWAKWYYDRFERGYKPVPTPAVYFERIYAITRYPFITPAALVSIPIQFIEAKAWQALAHELGHHIYWNSAPLFDEPEDNPLDYQGLHDRLKQQIWGALTTTQSAKYDQWIEVSKVVGVWMSWLEETFADTTGTLMGGVDYVESAIGLANEYVTTSKSDDNPDDLTAYAYNTGEHPCPYLRPQIAVEALAWKAKKIGDGILLDEANRLRDQVERFRQKAKKVVFPDTEQWLKDMETQVEVVTVAILETLWVDHAQNDGTRLGDLFQVPPQTGEQPPGLKNLPPVDIEEHPEDENGAEAFDHFYKQIDRRLKRRPRTTHPNADEKERLREEKELLRDEMLKALSKRSPWDRDCIQVPGLGEVCF